MRCSLVRSACHVCFPAARSQAESDSLWGEHEIDHVLFCQPAVMPKLHINRNEVESVLFLSREDIASWVASAEEKCVLLFGV